MAYKKSILLLPLLSLCVYAAPSSQADIQALQAEVKKLQHEIQELKKTTQKHQDDVQNEMDDLYDYTESVETKVLANKINFGIGLKFGSDTIDKTYENKNEVKSENLLSTKFMLNLKADIADNLKFYGRLTMYKYWGSSIQHPFSYYDNMQGRVPSDSGLYVERAYLDWFFLQDTQIPLALTIGRQPSTDGPSHQFKDNVSRKATYSALLYDGAADGAVLTANLSKVLSYDKTYLRFGYSRGFGYVETSIYSPNPYVGASDANIKNTDVYGLFFDTTLPNVENSLIQLSGSRMKDIIANPLDNNYTNNKNLGDMDFFGAMVEVTNFQNKNLDLFAHYGYNISHPNGKTYVAPDGTVLGLLGDSEHSKRGHAYWLGGRYGFGEDARYKIGVEYNHGSQNWVSLTQGSYDFYNKLATRGDAYELYGMYVVNRYFNFRLGYINIDYDYIRSGWLLCKPKPLVEEPSDIPNSESHVAKLNAIYLRMNLAY